MANKIIIASQNKHKIEEIKPLLPASFQLIILSDLNFKEEIPETGNTLEANALQKAMFIYEKFHIPCFADDTGLEVEALDGRPGVYSARYAGEGKSADDNIAKLLSELKYMDTRKATFRTVIALVGMNKPHFFEGFVNGTITKQKQGKSGFGYDPVFMPDGYSKTFAEMTLKDKNKLSHRAMAVEGLCKFLNSAPSR